MVSLGLLVVLLGYVASLATLVLSLEDRDGKPGRSLQDVVVKYRGSGRSRLESELRGDMKEHLEDPAEEIPAVVAWLQDETLARQMFDERVQPILEESCTPCHSREPVDEDKSDAPLETYEDVVVYARQRDTGISSRRLAVQSHVHLFGMGALMALLSLLLWLTDAGPKLEGWLGGGALVLVILDVAAWWLIKLSPIFVYLSVLAGGLFGLCLVALVFVPLHDMWWRRRPASRSDLVS